MVALLEDGVKRGGCVDAFMEDDSAGAAMLVHNACGNGYPHAGLGRDARPLLQDELELDLGFGIGLSFVEQYRHASCQLVVFLLLMRQKLNLHVDKIKWRNDLVLERLNIVIFKDDRA